MNPNLEESSKPSSNRSGCRLVILIVVVFPYLFQALFLIIPSLVNQIKWKINGSENYTYVISKYGFFPHDIQTGRIVHVQAGEVIEVSNVSNSENVEVWDITTIEGIFNGVYLSALLPLLSTCSYKYDPTLGYPTEITRNCPIPDACYSKTVITILEIH